MADPIASWPFTFAPFGFITGATPNVPEFYWNVVSDEQRWKFLCVNLASLVDYANELGVQIGVNASDIAQLESEFEKFKESGFIDYYEAQITAWIDANMQKLMAQAIKFVMFGINADGHLVAYVPDSWSEIQFDWGRVYGRSDYNRIILRFDAEGNAINNTYSYSLAQSKTLEQLIADLEVTTRRGDISYNLLTKNLDEEIDYSNSTS